MVDPLNYISRSSQCTTTGVTKAVVCVIMSEELCYSERAAHVVAVAGLLSHCLNGALPYVRRHVTVLKCVECVIK